MDFEKILRLVEAVSASELTGFSLEEHGMRLSLEKKPASAPQAAAPAALAGGMLPTGTPGGIVPAAAVPALQTAVPVPAAASGPADAALSAVSGPAALSEGGAAGRNGDVSEEEIVKAPLVGTFYAAPSEDAEPFVKTGDAVKKGQVLGIIEAMKLMNEIESECDGVVEAVLISNEQVVEYGQPLFRIRRKG